MSSPSFAGSSHADTSSEEDELDGERELAFRGPCRRAQPTSRVSKYSFIGGRRREVRRSEEVEGSFVDLYGFRLWLVLLWVAAMNVADSYFTLVHLQAGGIELNPIAEALLGTGRMQFVLAKSLLIAVALIVLCVHKNFLLARLGLLAAAGTYTVLVAYHLSLFQVG